MGSVVLVKLVKPKLVSARGLDVDCDSFFTEVAAPVSSALSPSWPFGVLNNTLFLSAQQNNIGCLIQPGLQYTYTGTTSPAQSSSSASGGFSAIFPASFNGNCRVTVQISGTGLTVQPNLVTNTGLCGNFTLISDLYIAGTSSPFSAYSCLTSTLGTYVVDVYVRQATGIAYNANLTQPNGQLYSGGNNILSFTSATATNITGCSIRIEQYQPLGGINGMSNTGSRLTWVNASNNVVIP